MAVPAVEARVPATTAALVNTAKIVLIREKNVVEKKE